MSYVFGLDITTLGLECLAEWADYAPNVGLDQGVFLVEDQGVVLAHKPAPLENSWRELLLREIRQKKL